MVVFVQHMKEKNRSNKEPIYIFPFPQFMSNDILRKKNVKKVYKRKKPESNRDNQLD